MNAAASKPTQRKREQPLSHSLTQAQQNELAGAKRAALWVGLILPLAVVTFATTLLIVWLPRMPDPAATHWGGTGGPDGFGSPTTYVWLNIGIGYGMTLMMWAMIALSGLKQSTQVWSPYQRFLVSFAAGFAVFMSFANVMSAAVQLDLKDAKEAPAIGWITLAGFGIWVIVAVAAWFVQPKVDLRRAIEDPIEALPLTGSERAVWFGESRPSKGFFWVMGLALATVALSVVFMFAVPTDPVARAITVIAFVLVLVLGVMCSWFRVRIDKNGLEARSVVGWPVFRLPAIDIDIVEATQISPFAEFGGWGMRWAPGRFGIVLRTGEGIIATRKDGRLFAVTVDDSERAAAVLAAAAKSAEGATK